MLVTCATCNTQHEAGTRCPNTPLLVIPAKVLEAMRIVYEWANKG